jgi:mono/diheme cytochrome c family protein
MKTLTMMMACGVSIALLSATPAAASGRLMQADKQAVKQANKGEAVYATLRCSLCHSLDGKGAKAGPLDDIGTKLTADEIREWIEKPAEMTKKHNATRKPAMRAYPNLPKEDLDALVTFLASKKKK